MALADFGVNKSSVKGGKFTGLNGVLVAFGEKLVADLGKSLAAEKDTTGALRNSIQFTTKVFGQLYTFELSMLKYYQWVDEGRPAGKKGPPIQVLKSWISNKNTFNEVKTKKGLKTLANDIQGVNQLAFLIGRKIRKKGIKATHFYSKVVNDGRLKKLSEELTKEAGREIIIDIKHFVNGLNSNAT